MPMLAALTLLAQTTTYSSSSSAEMDPMVSIAIVVVSLVLNVIYVAALWVVFKKAGHPGWHAIVPILNVYTMLKVAGRPGWWLVLFLIPCVSFVVSIVVMVDLARVFGKGSMTGVGAALFPWIFLPVIASGSPRWIGEDTYQRAPYQPIGDGAWAGVQPQSATWGGQPGFAGPLGPAPGSPAAGGPPPLAPLSPAPVDPPPLAPLPPEPAPVEPAASETVVSEPAESESIEPGWYPDPGGTARVRWWTGTEWTEHVGE